MAFFDPIKVGDWSIPWWAAFAAPAAVWAFFFAVGWLSGRHGCACP